MTDIPDNTFSSCSFNTLIIGSTVKTIGTGCFGTIYKTIWLPNVVPSGNPKEAEGKINYCSSTAYKETSELTANLYHIYSTLTSRFEVDGVIYALLNNQTQCDVIDCNYESNPVSINIGSTVTHNNRTFNVRNINKYACYDDDCITGDIIISNQGDVDDYAFQNCYMATGNLNLTNQGNIGNYSFSNCNKIAGTITVNNQGHIGNNAFQNCSKAQAGIVSNEGNVGNNAFSGCSGFKTLSVSNNGNIGISAFTGCTGLETLAVSNSGEIGKNAFKSSKITQSATINNNGHIQNCAFYGVTGSFSAEINNLGAIADSAFFSSEIKTLTIGNKVTTIGKGCFQSSTIKEQATIENSGEISEYAFYKATGNFNAEIKSNGVLPNYCFSNTTMKNVIIGEQVTLLGENCFSNSTLNSVTIGNNVSVIETNCFKSTSFSSILIGSGVHTIKNSAFEGAKKFTTIILPNNVTTLGSSCFQNCTSMQQITLSRGLSEISESTFSGCTNLNSLFVPNTINKINDFVFNNCSALKTLVFEDKPEGVYTLYVGGTTSSKTPLFSTCGLDSVYLGGRLSYATTSPTYSPFRGNTTLRAIKFTDKEIKIYAKEFENCTNLQNVWMGANIDDIGQYAFSGCTALERITISPKVLQLGQYSFSGCTALKKVELANVETIQNNTFQSCTSLSEIVIPSSTTNINNQAFRNCVSLKNLIIKDRTAKLNLGINSKGSTTNSYKGITGAGTPLFSDCPLDSVYIGGPIYYSQTLESGYSPFFYNESLRSVFITNKEKTVYTNEFYNCLGLQRIKLGDGVTNIKEYGFQSCIGLLYFEFASSLQNIGKDAFSDCTNIRTIISHSSTPPTLGDQALEDINFWECKLYVPEGSEAAYQEADQWKNFFITTMKMAESISLNTNNLTLYEVGETSTLVATIEPEDVWDNSVSWSSSNISVATVDQSGVVKAVANGTTTITAKTNDGTNLTAICEVTVSGSPNIEFVDSAVKAICVANWDTNGDGELSEAEASRVTDLGKVFENTEITSFNELVYFTGITKMSSFSNCSNLTAITIPKGVVEISSSSFNYCYALEDIVVESGNPKYDSRNNCNAIIETSTNRLIVGGNKTLIPNGVTEIWQGAFADRSGLTSLNIPESVTKIQDSAFTRCISLTSITTPNSVTKIGNFAFSDCSSLTSVTIGSGLIYTQAFDGCSSLTSVTIGNGVTKIYASAFINCNNLSTVVSMSTTPATISAASSFPNRANITLYVPAGSKATYMEAAFWKEFKEIIEMSTDHLANSITLSQEALSLEMGEEATLTATILPAEANQEVLWTSSNSNVANVNNGIVTAIAAGTAIITATTVDGTELSASCVVTVTPLVISGDANSDGEVNVTDYLAVANYILGNNTSTFNLEAADVNNDDDINVSDYVGVANIILYGNYQGPSVNAIHAFGTDTTIPWLELEYTEDGYINLLLNNARAFSAFQMDIRLPEGVEVIDAQMAMAKQTRNLGYSKLQDGSWRLLYGTLENDPINLADRKLLKLRLSNSKSNDGGYVGIDHVYISDYKASTLQLNSIYDRLPTGLGFIEEESVMNGNYYDLNGRKVDDNHKKKGIYVVNGKKIITK